MADHPLNDSYSEDTDSDSSEESTEQNEAMCQVCQKERHKYTCPRCAMHTCSLPCVQKHKQDLDCSGKRDRTAFVAKEDFTESHLRSDYFFLEEVRCLMGNMSSRGVFIDTMPKGMFRHQRNKSFFHIKSRTIHWTIDWKFPEENISFMDERVPDVEIVEDILERHVKAHQEQAASAQSSEVPLQGYSADTCKVLYKVYGQWKFCLLDKAKSLLENLRGKRVVEFPTLFVVREESEDKYPILPTADAEKVAMFDYKPLYFNRQRFKGRKLDRQGRGRGRGSGRGRGFGRGGRNRRHGDDQPSEANV
ncbi:hypothetical protein ACOMHN_012609 [Nucella lapillus]